MKKIVFGLIAFIAVFTSEAALVIATSDFLTYGLIDQLPVVFLLVALLVLVDFGLSVVWARRFSALGSFLFSVMFLMAMGAIAFNLNYSVAVFLSIALLITRVTSLVFDTSLTNFASSYVNQRQAKGFLPLIRGIMDMAIIAASVFVFAMTSVERKVEPVWLIIIGAVMIVVGLMLVNRMFDTTGRDEQEPVLRLREQVTMSVGLFLKQSPLYRLFVVLFFFFGGILPALMFVYNNGMVSHLTGEELTKLLAVVNMVAVVLRALFNLRGLQNAIYRCGLANLLLVYAWGMFVLGLVITLFPSNMYLAIVLYVFHAFSFYSYVVVTAQSMFGLVPSRIGQQIFFFVKGFVPSVAALMVSLLMVAALFLTNQNPVVINFILYCLVAGTLVITLRVKKQYQKTLMESIDSQDLGVKTSAVELVGEVVQMEKGERLLRKILLDTNESSVLRQKALTSIVEINNPNSIRELLLIVEKDPNMRLRYYAMQAINTLISNIDKKKFGSMVVTRLLLMDVVNRVYEEDLPLAMKLEVNKCLPMYGFDALLQFYKTHFANSPDFIKASIIESLAESQDRGMITVLEPYLCHENLTIRAAAIVALWPFIEIRDRLMGLAIEIFSFKDEYHRMVGLQLISKLKLQRMETYVLDLVAMTSKDLSTMAIITIITLGRSNAVSVLVRRLVRYAILDDIVMVEFIFRKLQVLSGPAKTAVLNEIRGLSTVNFEQLRQIFNNSNHFFDIALADLFTN